MLHAIARGGGVKGRLVRVPAWVFRGAGGACSALRLLGLRRLPFSRDKAEEILARHWTLQTGPSHDALGIDGETPFPDGVAATWEWYREAGWLPRL
jgi:hypothetical protein